MIKAEPTAKDLGGAHLVLKLDGRYLGHFYPDYERREDYEAFLEYLEAYPGDKPPSERK